MVVACSKATTCSRDKSKVVRKVVQQVLYSFSIKAISELTHQFQCNAVNINLIIKYKKKNKYIYLWFAFDSLNQAPGICKQEVLSIALGTELLLCCRRRTNASYMSVTSRTRCVWTSGYYFISEYSLYRFSTLFGSLYLSQRAFQVSNLRTNPFYRKHTNTKSHPPSGFATFAERHSMKKGG